jgi:hypothetical protein
MIKKKYVLLLVIAFNFAIINSIIHGKLLGLNLITPNLWNVYQNIERLNYQVKNQEINEIELTSELHLINEKVEILRKKIIRDNNIIIVVLYVIMLAPCILKMRQSTAEGEADR